MNRSPIITERDGCRVVEMPVPVGWEVVEAYHPHTTPWDYYGMRRVREVLAVLRSAGIEGLDCHVQQTKLHPVGTGSGGRVRFGDAMLPGVYRVAVRSEDREASEGAMALHRTAVTAWLDGSGPMPEACK